MKKKKKPSILNRDQDRLLKRIEESIGIEFSLMIEYMTISYEVHKRRRNIEFIVNLHKYL